MTPIRLFGTSFQNPVLLASGTAGFGREVSRVIDLEALGGIVTGALLAMARAAGETAPLLFTAFGNDIVQTNPFQPMGALSLTVFRNALVPYNNLQDQAWAAALLLVMLVAATNILARLYVRRSQH